MRSYFRVCRHCGDMHQLGRWPDNCKDEAPLRSDLAAPYVIRDSLPGGVNGLYHHGVAKKIDSKSGYRRATKESGCIEVGNEHAASVHRPAVEFKSNVIESGINDALHQLGLSSDSDMGKLDYGN